MNRREFIRNAAALSGAIVAPAFADDRGDRRHGPADPVPFLAAPAGAFLATRNVCFVSS
jgi:hypothetical protein